MGAAGTPGRAERAQPRSPAFPQSRLCAAQQQAADTGGWDGHRHQAQHRAPRTPKTQQRARRPRDASPGRGPVSVARFGRPLRAATGLWPRSIPLPQVRVNTAQPAEFCEFEELRRLRSSPPICYTTWGKSFAQQSLQDNSLSPGFALPAPSSPQPPGAGLGDPCGSLTAPDTR